MDWYKISRIIMKVAGINAAIFALLITISLLINEENANQIKFFSYVILFIVILLSFISWCIDKRNQWVDRKRKRESLPLN